ncbi:RNA pseudouridylate synthase,putative [Plasmodium sp. gorilla clade G2]|uniref:RNA pseudouridylate synthase,putative n=1 Tax=Plasmodium sp. gorilla clade G2 TaxID=880535 RepID=UPI000D209E71|nr:RNA pseudouridylate synthase,putative [Plasmodium sp. gorilla clade G2]SOV16927.1 RNA pseudouridylate synthase,putative [Plasmodium sp. gorilla clade G2]
MFLLTHNIQLRIRKYNNSLIIFEKIYRYICDDIKKEIIEHSYSKEKCDNLNLSEECKKHIDFKQKLFYDYVSKENHISPFLKKKEENNLLSYMSHVRDNHGSKLKIKINKKKEKEDEKLDDEKKKKKKKEDVEEEEYDDNDEILLNNKNVQVQYMGEYKKWIKKKKNNYPKEEDNKNEDINQYDSPDTNISTDNNDNFISEEKKNNKSDDLCNILQTNNNIMLDIDNDLKNIYIDNSKYFKLDIERNTKKEKMKLNQYCSYNGICSSRFVHNNVQNGLFKVNDKIVYENVDICSGVDKIELTNRGKDLLKNKITIILNKPKHYLSISNDNKSYKKLLVRNLIRNENKYIQEEHKCMSYFIYKNVDIEKVPNLYVCGRLDANSSGLLIFTQNTLSNNYLLYRYKYNIEKEYVIKTYNIITQENMKLLKEHFYVDGKLIYKCHIQYVDNFTLIFKIYQGFHKIIRKMCMFSNIKIKSLHRIRIGNIHLNDLPTGKWRFLMPNEYFF